MPPDLPRFSLRLHQGLTPQACRALAVSAEAHGFHTLWFAENPFGRAILPAVAACAADTSRVRLGLGILNPYQHHPTLIAQEAAVLDELSGGGSDSASAPESANASCASARDIARSPR